MRSERGHEKSNKGERQKKKKYAIKFEDLHKTMCHKNNVISRHRVHKFSPWSCKKHLATKYGSLDFMKGVFFLHHVFEGVLCQSCAKRHAIFMKTY